MCVYDARAFILKYILLVFQVLVAAAAAKSLQSCPTLCGPIDGSPPGSAVPGILQARVPEWGPLPSPMGVEHPSYIFVWCSQLQI